jgi:hypothetical protein
MNKNFKGYDRIGQSKINRQDCKMTIVEYKNSNKIVVEFDDENKTRVNTTYYGFSHGEVRNPNLKDCRQMEYEKQFLGKENYNTQGCLMKIIEYNGNGDVVVEFQDEHKIRKHCDLKEFKLGHVMNPYYKSVFGIGYYGGEIPKHSTNLDYKCWDTWKGMLERCYNKKCIETQPTYKGCIVCEEWHDYQNFKVWFNENFIELKDKNERVCLDKDILVKGNKIYSPETCCFVPNEINVLFTKTNKNRGLYPIGVYYKKKLNKYIAQCSEKIGRDKKQQKHLGVFNTPKEAFEAYKQYKEMYIKKVADKYKGQIKDNVYEALYKWEVEIDD